ncbi:MULTISPECIES: Gfo/Idh/MocA family oxidoreductase [unclassified Sinorhizobium]|uniref:Gfo/Idh/MocA family protein n=1 Tax=unclassified Sinorhizobium TaxID=2613772 RepID=UPI0024C39406|nr:MULTISPECIES: Gfo/Idh/MocA family oxidoreductase [unclassified Sinorhizobium]MDK1374410.1 Gfo/Idh/MocA family oxidoreductase [Sinorhizobium sp. 6-70]MDK1478937.1 Gfo/Idh/MocA family oxidoreductase [Sinorhizobium sp. 6-117]
MSVKTVAIIGCGIGRSHIVEGYLPHPDKFQVTALCDLNVERLNEVGNEFGIEKRTTSFKELLADDSIDIIDICTPPGIHLEQVLDALASGKHVICEKPLTGSLKGVDRIMEAEKQARGVLMPIFQYRYGDGIEKAKRIIDSGIAGKPYVGSVETFWLRTPEYYSVPWRGKWETELGGVLVTHALHLHDMMLHLLGPAAKVFGRVATRVNDIEVEDCASASLLMQNGAFVSLSCTLGSQEQISRLRLHFEHVTFESSHEPYAPGKDPWKIIAANEAVQAKIDDVIGDWRPVSPRFTTQMAHFHAFLTGTGPLPVTTKDARQALELVTAIYQSADTGREITLPIGPESPKYANWRANTR